MAEDRGRVSKVALAKGNVLERHVMAATREGET